MRAMLARGKPKSGSTLVEFALVLPMLLILIANVINFGGFFFDWITVENATRSAVQYYILGGVTVGAPSQPPITTTAGNPTTPVDSVAYSDMLTLLKSKNYSGQVCTKRPSGVGNASPPPTIVTTCTAIGAAGGTFPPAPPDDPSLEANLYSLAWVDVVYTYQPYIPLGFRFPGLGLYVTLPNNLNVHRRTIMRVEN